MSKSWYNYESHNDFNFSFEGKDKEFIYFVSFLALARSHKYFVLDGLKLTFDSYTVLLCLHYLSTYNCIYNLQAVKKYRLYLFCNYFMLAKTYKNRLEDLRKAELFTEQKIGRTTFYIISDKAKNFIESQRTNFTTAINKAVEFYDKEHEYNNK